MTSWRSLNKDKAGGWLPTCIPQSEGSAPMCWTSNEMEAKCHWLNSAMSSCDYTTAVFLKQWQQQPNPNQTNKKNEPALIQIWTKPISYLVLVPEVDVNPLSHLTFTLWYDARWLLISAFILLSVKWSSLSTKITPISFYVLIPPIDIYMGRDLDIVWNSYGIIEFQSCQGLTSLR